ncbi:MAG: hypothetical protein ACE1Y1_02520 [Nitrosomonadaceae bacterium]
MLRHCLQVAGKKTRYDNFIWISCAYPALTILSSANPKNRKQLKRLARPTGFEPETPAFGDRKVNYK